MNLSTTEFFPGHQLTSLPGRNHGHPDLSPQFVLLDVFLKQTIVG